MDCLSPKLIQGYQVHTLFFLEYAKDLLIYVIKVEKFNTNNALLASALRYLITVVG